MKAFMEIAEMEARQKGCWINKETTVNVQHMIYIICVDFIKTYLDGANRQAEFTWSTMYNGM